MAYPAFPLAAIRNAQPNGGGSVLRASIPETLLARGPWLNERRGGTSAMWSRGLIADGIAPTTLNDSFSYGTFLCPPLGSGSGRVTIELYVEGYVAPDSLNYRVQFFALNPDGSTGGQLSNQETVAAAGTIAGAMTGGEGWLPAFTMPVTDSGGKPFVCEVTGIQASAASQKLASVSVYATPEAVTGESTPSAMPKTSMTAAGAADRPYDAYLLERIGSTYNHVAGRYPQTIVSHSFRADTQTASSGVASDSDSVTARYKVPIGPQVTDLTVYARGKYAGVDAVSGSVTAYVNGTVSTGVAGALSTSTAWVSTTIPAADLTANTVHEIKVRAHSSYAAGGTAETASMYDVIIVQGAFTETNFFVNNGTRVEAVAPRLMASTGYLSAKPIVAGFSKSAIQDGSGDRETLLRNALFLSQHKVMCLVADHIGTSAASTSTGAAFASAAALAQTRHQVQRGAGTIQVWAQFQRVGTTNELHHPRVEIWKGDLLPSPVAAAATGVILDIGTTADPIPVGVTNRRWYMVGTVDVTEGSTHEIEIRAGWVDGTGASSAAGADFLILSGVMIREVPAEGDPQAQYFFELNSGLSVAIPDNSPTGATTTITVDPAFTVRRVRVHCHITHSAIDTIEVRLISPTGTARKVRLNSLGSTGAKWFSDAAGGFTTPDFSGGWLDDETPNQTLSNFIGETSAGTWTLKAADNAAVTTGTITAFGLELF